ncbi:MAG: choice-of-anchor K domain-containing protein [Actinomycetota bacterium]
MATAVISGTWPSMSASPPNLNGLGTEHLRWGVPAGGGGQSGYRFGGGTVPVMLDGSEFTLGTFTHENFPVQGFSPSQFDVDLKVNVAFDEGNLERAFSFRFHHNETPNTGPTPDDEVDLPTLQSPETVIIDGSEYAVMISGFKQNGQIVTKFISAENGANRADIVAKLVLVGKPDVVITNVHFKGVKPNQPDEYIEIINRGTAPADISGWLLHADDGGQDFRFPAGLVLKPGQSIRIYTNETHPDTGGFSYGIKRPIWNNKGDLARLQNTGGEMVSQYGYGERALP